MNLDVVVFRVLNWFAGEWELLDHTVRVLAGDHLVPMTSALTLVWLWFAGTSEPERARFQRTALAGLTALGITSGVVSLLAIATARARPFGVLPGVDTLFYLSTDPSFPAHSTAVVVALGVAVRRGHRQWGNLILGAGVSMGVARVIAGNSWPSDILAAAVIGIGIGLVSHLILRRIEPLTTLITLLGFGSPQRSTDSSPASN